MAGEWVQGNVNASVVFVKTPSPKQLPPLPIPFQQATPSLVVQNSGSQHTNAGHWYDTYSPSGGVLKTRRNELRNVINWGFKGYTNPLPAFYLSSTPTMEFEPPCSGYRKALHEPCTVADDEGSCTRAIPDVAGLGSRTGDSGDHDVLKANTRLYWPHPSEIDFHPEEHITLRAYRPEDSTSSGVVHIFEDKTIPMWCTRSCHPWPQQMFRLNVPEDME
ncbi:hypothetical protein BDN72DRAFT_858301 [Pluteus cervinus]|uniref:Uncharacterized protein n=1 Tax=Pluteus cervinus TaxID=181527 RepID=A0ACD3AS99_9AGAR|nr:hypothetical protein BDN72DRAFT_858301 [Pluteus cervinus]